MMILSKMCSFSWLRNTFRPGLKSLSSVLYDAKMHSYDHFRQEMSPEFFCIGPFLGAVGHFEVERLLRKHKNP